jgi:hypothetical protein
VAPVVEFVQQGQALSSIPSTENLKEKRKKLKFSGSITGLLIRKFREYTPVIWILKYLIDR